MSPNRLPNNTYWVQPGQLLAGEYPGTKYPEAARFKLTQFLDAGVTAFLDLTHAHELAHYADTMQALASDRGLNCVYRRMPIVDMRTPTTPQQMQAILAQIQVWQAEQRVVYVHCWGGVGRTGTVVGCYLVNSGMTGNAALQRIAQYWQGMSEDKRNRHPQSPQTPAQCDYVRHWAVA